LSLAYMMSWFPTVTETFILHEILELERRGERVEIFPLFGKDSELIQPGGEHLVQRAFYEGFASPRMLTAQLYWLRKNPRGYLRSWWRAMKGNLRSPDFLWKAVVVVPRAALFAREMEARGVTHVHCHWATHPTLAAVVIQELAGIPYSFTCHAHDIYVDRTMLQEKIRDARFFVTISDFNRRLLTDLYGSDASGKMSVIRCGVRLEPVPRRPRTDPPTLITVASLRDYKGHRYLIDACAELAARGVRFQLLCAGEGEERESLERQIRERGLEDKVKLLGAKSQREVRELIATASAMVLPSVITGYGKMEGIPVALMEALASELPVVATAISGIPELVEDGVTGLTVPQRDPRALASAIERVLADPEAAARMARSGRERVEREFSLERNTARLAELLVPAAHPEVRA
jgi:colanic acid/amylovoran biosynthesis glycosyltransferase